PSPLGGEGLGVRGVERNAVLLSPAATLPQGERGVLSLYCSSKTTTSSQAVHGLALLAAIIAAFALSGCAHRRSDGLTSTAGRPTSTTPMPPAESKSAARTVPAAAVQQRSTSTSDIRLASADDSPAS